MDFQMCSKGIVTNSKDLTIFSMSGITEKLRSVCRWQRYFSRETSSVAASTAITWRRWQPEERETYCSFIGLPDIPFSKKAMSPPLLDTPPWFSWYFHWFWLSFYFSFKFDILLHASWQFITMVIILKQKKAYYCNIKTLIITSL